jgi:hypothetical protein
MSEPESLATLVPPAGAAEPQQAVPVPHPTDDAPNLKDLPSLDKGASSFYDIDKGTWWLGIPLGTGTLMALVIIDSAKMDFMRQQEQFVLTMQRRQSLIAGIKGKAKSASEGFGAMMDRLKSGGKKLIS